MSKTEDQVTQLSGEAERIWNSPLVRDFMDNFVKEVFVEWTNEQDQTKRDLLWLQVQAADKFKGRFLGYMAGGKAIEKRKDGSVAAGVGPII